MTEDKKISRRSFLNNAAVLGAGVMLSANFPNAVGVDESAKAKEGAAPVEILDHDIVICGTGAGGMAAACRAGQLGADVIVLEALDEAGIGGATNNAEGMGVYFNDDENGSILSMLIDGDVNIEMGLKPLTDIYKTCLDYHKNQSNALVLKTFLNRSLENYYWVRDEIGVEFQKPETATQMYKANSEMSGGHAMIKTMYKFALGKNIPFRFNTAGKELIMKDGRVAGIIARKSNGDLIQINCKAVIMAGGGYLANKELFEKYTKFSYDGFMMYGSCGKEDGAAYTMGEAVGAAFHHPECIMYCGPILPGYFNKAKITVCCANDGSNLWVNEHGKRFIAESNANDFLLVFGFERTT